MKFIQTIKEWFSEKLDKKQSVSVTPKKTKEENTTMSDIDQIRKTDKLSKNFTLSEILKSQTASRRGIDNTPDGVHLQNMKALVDNILQPLRDSLGMPIIITSGYRSPRLNDAIGGSDDSQHSKGEAVDIECIGLSNKELAHRIKESYDFDQLILEFYNPNEGPNSGWVHVSYKKDGSNRNEVLTAMIIGGDTVYSYGITDQ